MKKSAQPNLKVAPKPGGFISRELSWLDFNSRVLDEAECAANPVLERLKFVAITSSNLDEFFMVRIAGLRQLANAGSEMPDPAGNRPSDQLAAARTKIEKLVRRQYRVLFEELLPALEEHNIFLRTPTQLEPAVRRKMSEYFREQVLPVLTPLAVDAAHPFPILNSGAIELALSLTPQGRKETVHAFVEVPDVLPRFILVPGAGGRTFVRLESLIIDNLDQLFPCGVREWVTFRITRDMDFAIEDDGVEDLLQSIGKKLLLRRHRAPIRLEIEGSVRNSLTDWLRKELELDDGFCYRTSGFLHLKQLFALVGKINLPELAEPPWPAVMPPEFAPGESVFNAIDAKGTILVAVPFHSFSPVLRFLNEAADDPDVLAIKQTLYRVSGNSPVVAALRRAAENGKQVTALVELKARFDEGNNIAWARALDESGAHVVYGVAGLKVHCKSLLVIRRENGTIRRYVHLATGNYNDKTAAMYTDVGILSNDPGLCFDVANLFNMLTGYSAPPMSWNQVAVSPFTLRSRLENLIEREIRNTTPGRPGRIIAKMNSLCDVNMVKLLHRAADAGVEIDLIVRGICTYLPKPGQDNMRIVSIVDRYLEHSRIFYFRNQGEEEYYLSSADWMTRNLDRRIELMFPVTSPEVREKLRTLLDYQLNDTDKVRKLQASGVYTRPHIEHYTAARSQHRSWRFFKEQAEEALKAAPGRELKVFTAPPKPAE